MNNIKTYLGDSVYAEFDGGMVCLTTNNGYGIINTIYLELEVYKALVSFVQCKLPWYQTSDWTKDG